MRSVSVSVSLLAGVAALLVMLGTLGSAQKLPKGLSVDDLANNNKLFLELALKGLKWEEPAEPVRIAGPV